jgi:N-methylhydantoinase A/acetophenone carboxylase
VFSAFGSSVADISHVYERSFHLPLRDGADVESLNHLIEGMRKTGVRDLLGEGIKPDQTEFSVELELSQPSRPGISVKLLQLRFASLEELRSCLGSDLPRSDIVLELVRMRVTKPLSRHPLMEKAAAVGDSIGAAIGKRAVAYGSTLGEADRYKWESLQPGQSLQGCCILEAENSTYFVPEGWILQIDQYGNAHVQRTTNEPQEPSTSSLQESRSYGKPH